MVHLKNYRNSNNASSDCFIYKQNGGDLIHLRINSNYVVILLNLFLMKDSN